MESDVDRAAHALQRGATLEALAIVGRLDDPRALLLRGVAYAQLGDFALATSTLRRASLGADLLTDARAEAALAELDLAAGRARSACAAAERAAARLATLGDERNATLQRLVAARARVLLGDLGGAADDLASLPDRPADIVALVRAEIAMRRLDASAARRALDEAARSEHALLRRTAATLMKELERPVARFLDGGGARAVGIQEIALVSSGRVFLVDSCRRVVRAGRAVIPLARRPILFGIVLALARAGKHGAARDVIARTVFDVRTPNRSHRVRLRVEISRLRSLLRGVAAVTATEDGYRLESRRPTGILLPLVDTEVARLAILLGDGAAWTANDLADHTGLSKRTVLRALRLLVEQGRVRRLGAARDTRYASMGEVIASRLLLLGLASES